MKYLVLIGVLILVTIGLVGYFTRASTNPMEEVFVQEIRTQSNGRCVVVTRGYTSQGGVAVSCQWNTGTMTGYQVVR